MSRAPLWWAIQRVLSMTTLYVLVRHRGDRSLSNSHLFRSRTPPTLNVQLIPSPAV